MSKVVIANNQLKFRTRLFKSQSLAQGFGKFLEGNGKFSEIRIAESNRSAGKFYVEFFSSNPETLNRMTDELQKQRIERSREEGKDYKFRYIAGGLWRIHNPKSGMTYNVSLIECECKDWIGRCKPLSLICKHQAWLAEHILQEEDSASV